MKNNNYKPPKFTLVLLAWWLILTIMFFVNSKAKAEYYTDISTGKTIVNVDWLNNSKFKLHGNIYEIGTFNKLNEAWDVGLRMQYFDLGVADDSLANPMYKGIEYYMTKFQTYNVVLKRTFEDHWWLEYNFGYVSYYECYRNLVNYPNFCGNDNEWTSTVGSGIYIDNNYSLRLNYSYLYYNDRDKLNIERTKAIMLVLTYRF